VVAPVDHHANAARLGQLADKSEEFFFVAAGAMEGDHDRAAAETQGAVPAQSAEAKASWNHARAVRRMPRSNREAPSRQSLRRMGG